jgi:hypothetical protein
VEVFARLDATAWELAAGLFGADQEDLAGGVGDNAADADLVHEVPI